MENLHIRPKDPLVPSILSTKTLRLTTSVTSRTKSGRRFPGADFTSSGVLLDKQETIVLQNFEFSPPPLWLEPRPRSSNLRKRLLTTMPCCQTFKIDKTFTEGVLLLNWTSSSERRTKLRVWKLIWSPPTVRFPLSNSSSLQSHQDCRFGDESYCYWWI